MGTELCFTISFKEVDESSSGTETLTISAPSFAHLSICEMVSLEFDVRVLVMVWTAIGLFPPIFTLPTFISLVFFLSYCLLLIFFFAHLSIRVSAQRWTFFQYWFFAIFSVLCYFGYKGAKEFNNNYTVFYLFYVVLDFIGQIASIILVEENKDNIDGNSGQWTTYYVLQSLVFAIQLWIVCIVYNFMKNLKEISEQDLNLLRGNHPLQNVRFILV